MQVRFGLNLATLSVEARRINEERDRIIEQCAAGDWNPDWPRSIVLDRKDGKERIVVESIVRDDRVSELMGSPRYKVTGQVLDLREPVFGPDNIFHQGLLMLEGAGRPFHYLAPTDAEGNTDEFVRVNARATEPEAAGV